jgi:hypothetical protein
MKLSIWTHWEGKSWSGEIPDPTGEAAHWPLEYIFRWFNRVDKDDEKRMRAVGYDLPSLSVGDVVTLDSVRWQCDVWGFTELPVGAEPVEAGTLYRDGARERGVEAETATNAVRRMRSSLEREGER